jgi:hypothetical protein
MFGKGWTRKAFGQRIGHILRTCTFRQLDVVIAYELPQIMHSLGDTQELALQPLNVLDRVIERTC